MRRRYKPFSVYDDIENDRQFRLFEYFIGPVLALLVPILLAFGKYIIGALTHSQQEYDVNPTDLFIGIIVYLLADSTIRMNQNKEREKSYRQALDLLRQKMDGAFRVNILDDDEARDLLSRSFLKSYAVRNTFIGMKGLYGGDSGKDANLIDYYIKVLSKKGSIWEDIVGLGEYFDGRFSAIDAQTKSLSGQHRVSVLASHTPVLNFVLCGPQNREFSEVYFGWIRVASVEIFYSQDQRLIRVFDKYFDSLSSRPARIIESLNKNYSASAAEISSESVVSRAQNIIKGMMRSKPQDMIITRNYEATSWIKTIVGTWISVEGSAKNIENIFEYTVLEISCTDQIVISGTAVDIVGTIKSSFKSNSISLLDRAIMYRYKLGTTEGIGIYNLEPDNVSMRGYFVRDGADRSEIVRAVKVESERDVYRNECLARIIQVPLSGGI